MTLRTILVPADGTEDSIRCLDMGFRVAKRLEGHVTALHVRSDLRDTVPLLGEGMSVAMIEDMMDIAKKEGATRFSLARKAFDAAVQEHGANLTVEPSGTGYSASWVEEVGREDDGVATHGRLADLIIAARPNKGSDVSTNLTLNAALFETGRPVMVVPPREAQDAGRKIIISWNGSAQSARAVASAMPLLKRAGSVTALTIDSARTSSDRAPELATYLRWHGISADTQTISGPRSAVGPKLMETLEGKGADLLVMGAYTHSRMRQLILGGVTRSVLEQANVPVLMAH